MKLVGLVVAFCLLSSVSLAKKAENRGRIQPRLHNQYIERQGREHLVYMQPHQIVESRKTAVSCSIELSNEQGE